MKEIIACPGEIVVMQGDCIITSYALGSSLGICMYIADSKIGGFVNSILPSGDIAHKDSKYVKDGIVMLYDKLCEKSQARESICAKIIGGASLFMLPDNRWEYAVGKANIDAAHETLKQLQIPLLSEDVGDVYGRTIHFHLDDGMVYIETGNRYLYYI